jgi:hypothetical protein
MKRILKYTFLLLFMGFGLISCYKDTILPEAAVDPDGPAQFVSFKTDLAPIFSSKCALSGCHVSGAHKPYLTTDVSYQQIVNGGFINASVPKESRIYTAINSEMREYISSAADRQKIYDWIRNGTPNN